MFSFFNGLHNPLHNGEQGLMSIVAIVMLELPPFERDCV